MYNRYKTFAEYGIENESQLSLLPYETIDMIIKECFDELDRIPENIYRITKNNLDKIDLNTKIYFLNNIDNIKNEEKLIIENADVLSELDDLDILISAIPNKNKDIFVPKDNILYKNLYDFQKIVYEKLMKRKGKQILISETGSGKTITALAYAEQLYINRDIDKIIVVLANDEKVFLEELAKHLPYYAHNKYITMTYYNMNKKIKDLKLRTFDNILFILDEIHFIKNDSERGKFIQQINMTYMLGLTATLFDKVDDLDTLSYNIGTVISQENITIMESTLDIKKEVDVIKLELSNEEMSEINTIAMFSNSKLELQHKVIQKLNNRSEKIAELMTILEKHNNDKVIIFTNYIATADMLNSLLSNSMLINGSDNKQSVANKLRDFFYGKFNYLITTNILNQSYNLQKANVIIFYDFNYDSIKSIQTEGRIVRIGQEKVCYIYYMYHIGTIEEEIFNSIQNKKEDYNNMLKVMK